jgi:hypothetical protein
MKVFRSSDMRIQLTIRIKLCRLSNVKVIGFFYEQRFNSFIFIHNAVAISEHILSTALRIKHLEMECL